MSTAPMSDERLEQLRKGAQDNIDSNDYREDWHVYPIDAIALLNEIDRLRAELAEARKWKEAITEAAVVSWTLSKENENDPVKAVNDLLCWTQQVALDPAVSEPVAKLTRERDEALAELASVIEAAKKMLDDYEGWLSRANGFAAMWGTKTGPDWMRWESAEGLRDAVQRHEQKEAK